MGSRRSASRELLRGERFTAFYKHHADPLTLWFARRTVHPETAVDLTAETFAQAYVARKRFKGSDERDAAAWLYGIARHQLSRYHRKGRAERRALQRIGVELPPLKTSEIKQIEIEAGLAELRELLDRGLRRITQDQRDAISMRVLEEMPYPEVAARLGTSEATARARVSRGLRALEHILSAGHAANEEALP